MAKLPTESFEFYCPPIFTAHYPFDSQVFHFHGGPLIFENVNMTHQLEIWHSEESERIWASFRRFGTHYLLIKWAQIYYDDTIKIYMASTNSSSNLKLIFLIMSIIEQSF